MRAQFLCLALFTLILCRCVSAQVTRTDCLPSMPVRSADDNSQVAFDSVLSASYQRAIDSIRTLRAFVGVSAAVFLPGRGIWEGVSGSSYGAQAITPNMKFDIASNTKSFVSTVVLQLAEEGVVSLDDSLGKYIAPLPNIPGSVTLRQLLNMTSGLSDLNVDASDSAIFASPSKSWTPEEAISTFVGPPRSAPGGSWMYCNTNYLLLGMIVRQVTASSVSSQIRQRILTPLSLDSTYFGGEEAFSGPLAHPWYWDHGDISSMPRTSIYSLGWSAGAIVSTAENIAWGARAIFDGTLITSSSLAQMRTCVPLPPGLIFGGLKLDAYGLGVLRASCFGKTIWGHGGHGYGYWSFMAYDPELGASFAAFINQSPGDPEELIVALLDKTVLGVSEQSTSGVPESFVLEQNYPNPFNPSTTITYELPRSSQVRLSVYDMLGREVSVLVNERRDAGVHEVKCEGSNLASGVYLYRLQARPLDFPLSGILPNTGSGESGTVIGRVSKNGAEDFVQTRKMVVIK